VSTTQGLLIGTRAVQGVGGAIVSAVALSLIMSLFTESATGPRPSASSACMAGSGSVGVLLQGVLTDALSWHWIFLVNVPIRIAVYVLTLKLVPSAPGHAAEGRLDVAGAITVTTSLMLAVYAIVNGNDNGWLSGETLGLLAAAAVLLALFVWIESRVAAPLMPLAVLKLRNIWASNVIGVLWARGCSPSSSSPRSTSTLLGYHRSGRARVLREGVEVFSLGISAKLVMRFGIKPPLVAGFALASAALLLFARAPVDGSFAMDVLPAMILIGFGAGMAFNPVLLAAMSDVKPEDSGLASGVVNTAFMMGGALGLAVLASLARWRTDNLGGAKDLGALTSGYHLAFVIGAIFTASAAVAGATLLRSPAQREMAAAHDPRSRTPKPLD
jgi:MFS family permease